MRRVTNGGVLRLTTAFSLCALVLLTGLSGCKGFFTAVNNSTGGSTGGTSYVYVSNAGSTLSEYSLSGTTLTALSGSPIALTVAPTTIAISPNNSFLYVGTGTGVFMYTIGSNGELTEGNNNTVIYLNQSGLIVTSMAVDATSSWLLIAYQDSTEVDAIPISPTTGLVTALTPYIFNTTFGTVDPKIAISPNNTNVFVALGSGGTEAIGFNPTPTNTPWGTSVSIPLKTANTSDTAVAVDSTSTYLYITEADLSTAQNPGNLRLLNISSLGSDLGDYLVGVKPSSVLAELSGAYVYVTNATDGTISGFSLSTTNSTLTSLGSAFPTEKSPIGLIEDSAKAHIMAVGSGANPNLWVYSLDATSLGTLDVGSTLSTAAVNPSTATGIATTH